MLAIDPRKFDHAQIEAKLNAVDWTAHLAKLGWLTALADEREVKKALKAYQNFHGLLPTGLLDPQTLASFYLPRCGRPDVTPAGSLGMEAASGALARWSVSPVTWTLQGRFTRLTDALTRQAFDFAYNAWQAVSGLKMAYTADASTACIVITTGAIDGAGGVLGYSELPGPGVQRCTQRFDNAEQWVFSESPQQFEIDLARVACHEGGHALGIPHIQAGNLMQPLYGQMRTPQSGDIQEVVARYGAAVGPAPTVPAPGQQRLVLDFTGSVIGAELTGFRVTRQT